MHVGYAFALAFDTGARPHRPASYSAAARRFQFGDRRFAAVLIMGAALRRHLNYGGSGGPPHPPVVYLNLTSRREHPQ